MPKPIGRHREKVLSAVSIRKLPPGRHTDGGGLYLEVDDSGARRWTLRTVVHGRRRDIGLGSALNVTLAEARDEANRLRKIARKDGDPLAERNKRTAPDFEAAARECFNEHSESWRNAKHRAQWLSTLQAYAFPLIGPTRVDRIGMPEVLSVLTPIWLEKPETARRVRQRLGLVLEWAKAKGYREATSPTKEVGRALPKQSDKQQHHAALPFADVPAFLKEARGHDGAARALEFVILTAARTVEARGANWSEFDLDKMLWTIPAQRMKAKREHRVPLSAPIVATLKALKPSATGKYVFPGQKAGKPLSDMALLNLVQERMGYPHITVHGFRSSFRDWCSEQTNYPREVAEMALAHAVENKVEAAYRRTDLFEKRRALMDDWAAFCGGGAKVIKLKRVAS